MSGKFIPNGDWEFATMADDFAVQIAAAPARFTVTQTDAEALSAAVTEFREALTDARGRGKASRSRIATRKKEEAREKAERIIRRLANIIRASDRVDTTSRMMVRMRPRVEKAKHLPCPQRPPRLRFIRALHEGGATPMHELAFRDLDTYTSKKPPGAVRMELFVDLVPPEEPIPTHPGANDGGRPWYLRSYTRSPIVLAPPMARVPMRVVYWGRWADSVGGVGPFSATAAGWIEGGSAHHLPGGMQLSLDRRKPQPKILEDASAPSGRDERYSVALVDAQYQTLHSQQIIDPAPRLAGPSEREVVHRQIEGPDTDENAEEAA